MKNEKNYFLKDHKVSKKKQYKNIHHKMVLKRKIQTIKVILL